MKAEAFIVCLWVLAMVGAWTVTSEAQTPATGYVLATFPAGTVANPGCSPAPCLSAPQAPPPLFTFGWQKTTMTCGVPKPAGPTPTTPFLLVTGLATAVVNFSDPAAPTTAICTKDVLAQLTPNIPTLQTGVLYPVGVQATAPGTDASGNPVTLLSDWDLSANPFLRPVAPPAEPIGRPHA